MGKKTEYTYISAAAVSFLVLFFCAYAYAGAVAEPSTELKIAFHGLSDNGIRVYLSGRDGRAVEIIGGDYATFPSFSPDGNTLYFEGMGPSVFLEEEFDAAPPEPEKSGIEPEQDADFELARIYQIFKLDLTTNKAVQLSDGKQLDSHPVCSPDGGSIAFCSKLALPDDKNNEDPWRIYIMDNDGKNRRLLNPAGGQSHQLYPSWSPDSGKIVYVDKSFHKLEELSMTIPLSVLKIKDLKAGSTADLLTTFYYVDEPAWSPSGDKIAFSALDPKTAVKTIWLITADGRKLERVTDGPYDEHPAWNNDGTDSKLLFAHKDQAPVAGKNQEIKAGIYFLDLKSGTLVEFFKSDVESFGFPQTYHPRPALSQ